nr:hypothetical protein [Tanacetum cinerariifolium]
MLNPSPDAGIDSLFETTPRVDVQALTTVTPLTLTAKTLLPPTIPTISQFAGAVSSIPGDVERYMDQRMNEAIKEAEQVKVQVFKILQKIEKTVNEQLEAEVLTRSSNSSKTSYAMAADLSEMELKKILIEKMESNKSIQRSDEQRNLYKALEPLNYDKHALWGVSHWGQKRQQFYGFAVNREFALDVYSKRRIIAVTNLKIVEWHNYKHLDWISRRVEDLQLGVESYQKRLNLTKPDTYRSDLKQREAFTAYSYPRGFIYQNKDKKNRLMRIGELHKFSDGTLNDVRNAIDDRLKGIRMRYLPTTIWRKGDKDRAAAMIQAIDKMLKTRRIIRSLERFIGGRQYEGDFQMLQRTI